MFRDLLPPHLVKIIGNSSHEAKLRHKVARALIFHGLLGLYFDQGLFWFVDDHVVLILVILGKCLVPFYLLLVYSSEVNIRDPVIPGHSVVGHDDLADQLVLYCHSPLVLVLVLMLLVDVIDGYQNGFVPHDFLYRVHPEEVTSVQLDEISLVAVIHVQIIDLLLLAAVEELASPTDLYVFQLLQDVLEAVVQEVQEKLRVFPDLVYLYLFHVDRVLFCIEVLLLCSPCLIMREDVEAAHDWILDHVIKLRLYLGHQLLPQPSVVKGDLGLDLDSEDDQLGEGCQLDLIVIGKQLHLTKAVAITGGLPRREHHLLLGDCGFLELGHFDYVDYRGRIATFNRSCAPQILMSIKCLIYQEEKLQYLDNKGEKERSRGRKKRSQEARKVLERKQVSVACVRRRFGCAKQLERLESMRDLWMEIVLSGKFLKNLKHLRRGTIASIKNLRNAGKGLKDLSISFLTKDPSLQANNFMIDLQSFNLSSSPETVTSFLFHPLSQPKKIKITLIFNKPKALFTPLRCSPSDPTTDCSF